MAFKTKLSLLLLLLCISLLSATSLSLSNVRGNRRNPEDPQHKYQQICQRRCEKEESGKRQQEQCQQRCLEQLQYQQCRQQCQEEEQGQKQERRCLQRCEEQHREQEEERREEGGNPHREEREEQFEGKNNPFFFDQQSFKEIYRTEEGYAKVLQRFTKKSDLLRGIENYRLAYLEANPNTFVVPKHFDAEFVTFVTNGRGIIGLVQQEEEELYNIERGDVIRVPAGALVYFVNRDSKEKLQLVTLIQPIAVPGKFRGFFSAAGENPRSFFRSFSEEIVQAAFNIEKKDAERLFGKQSEGVVIKASEEQIQALSKKASSKKAEEGKKESRGPYNLLNKDPTYSNEYGQVYDVDASKFQQLQELDVSVTFTNLKKGAMLAPFYNSESTRAVFVVKGSGRYQMICPHLSSQERHHQRHEKREREQEEEEEEEDQYQRVSANLKPGSAYVLLAGHPFTVVASQNENLQLVVFGINARGNKRNFLAGKKNLLEKLESEAKELSFNIPAKEVDQLLQKQDSSYILSGPEQQQEGERQGRLASIFDFAGF